MAEVDSAIPAVEGESPMPLTHAQDMAALGVQPLQWSEIRISKHHRLGETIENNPREVLRKLAKALL
nr:hypothetical protein [Variovorax paradoxus]